jgi:hypothetical protein
MGIDVFGRNTYGGGQWNVCERFSVFGSGHVGQLFPIRIILAELMQKKCIPLYLYSALKLATKLL